MSKRNFILLIIVSVLAVAVIFGFLYLRPRANTPEDNNTPGTNFISQFNPFGNKPAPAPTPTPTNPPDDNPPATETPKTKLSKISSMPIAGYTVFSKERLKEVPVIIPQIPIGDEIIPIEIKTPAKKPTPPPIEFALATRYVEKATGNIYQTFIDKIEERKFSSTIIPKVHEAYFGNRGESVIMRYLKADEKTIETFVGTLPKELLGGDTTGENEIKGAFLADNVKDVAMSPDGSKLFYLFTSGENMIGTTLNLLNNKKVQIFDSRFTEWTPFWASTNTITLATKPSTRIPGYLYTIDSTGKNLTKALGGINGLTALSSPSGKLVLYANDDLSLSVYHTDTRTSDILGLKTLPEKCVWNKTSDTIYCSVPNSLPVNEYPDAWYQGEVSFSDHIWKIDVKTGNGTEILNPAADAEGEDVDAIKLTLDENENYLFFMNKKDSFLWKLELKQN